MHHATWLRCAVGMTALAAACTTSGGSSLDTIAEGYIRATLRLAQHQPELVEGWSGPSDWRPGPREPVAETRRRILSLATALDQLSPASGRVEDTARVAYLRGQLGALDLAARRLLGESTTFAEETRTAFALAEGQLVEGDSAAARAALEAALPGTGSLPARHEAFRRQFLIPADRREAVLRAALEACRDTTRTHVPLPQGESIALRFGVDSPWDGLARYDGHQQSTIDISSRGSLDVTRSITLACHEGYPGHHLQYLLIQRALVQAHGWTEFQLAPRFGPHLLVSEGAAEAGMVLAMPRDARVRLYRDRLLPLADLPRDAAPAIVEVEERVRALDAHIPPTIGAYLDSRASRDDTIDALGALGVVDAEAFLSFAERRRTAAVVYPIGRTRVERYLRAGGDPWARLVAIFTTAGLTLDIS